MLYDITFKRTNSISIPDYCTADFMDIWLLLNFTNLRFSERGGHEPIHTHTFALVADLDRYFFLSLLSIWDRFAQCEKIWWKGSNNQHNLCFIQSCGSGWSWPGYGSGWSWPGYGSDLLHGSRIQPSRKTGFDSILYLNPSFENNSPLLKSVYIYIYIFFLVPQYKSI